MSGEAVVLTTPHSLHRPMVEASARAGKQVFCEKPLALTTADAKAMIDACRRAGVVLGIGHNRRLWPSMQALKHIAASGELGEILHIEGHFSNQHSDNTAGTWRYDVVVTTNQFGDILTDQGAGLVGGLGLAPGLCIGERQAMAQATHGSAPDIAGKNIANPYALIMSGAMLLEWLGRKRGEERATLAAQRIDAAVERVIAGS